MGLPASTQTIKALIAPDTETRARRALERQLRREVDYFASVIVARLTRLNICYRYSKNKKDFLQSAVQTVRFLKAVGTPEAIYLMIDTRRLPRGIKVADLADEDILEDLSIACRRPIRFKYKVKAGAWFIIERASGVWGVPRKLVFADILDKWPEKSIKSLVVPLGVGENRKLFYRGLAAFPHALIGGATGAGKSTFQHAWICSLILKNQPWKMRLALIDLKGGAEFTRYKDLPHVLHDGFVKMPDGVIPLLSRLQGEMDGRLARFEEAGGIQNIDIWNYRHRRDRLARIVLFVDELAVIMLDRKLKSKAEALLADITARGRAPGIHVVLATQRPEVKVVSGLIKGNIDARFAFRVTDNASSMVILDNTEAARFGEDAPPGRYIYKRGLERYECQAPLITDGQIREIVRDVIVGMSESEMEATQIPPEEIFRISVQQLNGNFSLRNLYDALEGRASKGYLERLAREHEGQIIEVEGDLYVLEPSAGSRSRCLVPVEADVGKNGQDTGWDTNEIEEVIEDAYMENDNENAF